MLKNFGLLLIAVSVLIMSVVPSVYSKWHTEQVLLVKQSGIKNNYASVDSPEISKETVAKYSRIGGIAGIVFGLFCFFWESDLEKKLYSRKRDSNL